MPIAGATIPLNTAEGEDKLTITEKVTTTYLSNGGTELLGASVQTQSLADSNEEYYVGIAHTDTPTQAEWNVAYGHVDGNGGDDVDNSIKSPTQVVYKQWSNILLPPTEVTGGFFISRNAGLDSSPTNASIASGQDKEIYVLTARRSNMRDRINKKNWTIAFSGSLTDGAAAAFLHLTDDSQTTKPTATPFGDRYNIVSGSDGNVSGSGASDRTFGWFYPDAGVMVFSGTELSASIPGGNSGPQGDVVIFNHSSSMGFGTTTNQDANYQNSVRFVNCLTGTGARLKFRDEEDQVSAQYFCRLKAAHMNFSNNPTFVSGSLNELRQDTMKGNPTVYVTSVQLYNNTGDLVAVGNLSTPLKKNFSSEATIKVKLTY